ncbi:hypothetical protein BD626DRAFT_569813 [Schizophyllum amplum]|uniref:Uncharacterized protein n=1 Tax=Schizophyllum amplum TaxID=97359 RepID=A0A550CCY9_9AGAR|nr:hypothetical protein BD626DRAFT_569813 [Auriculariopsis ampla]
MATRTLLEAPASTFPVVLSAVGALGPVSALDNRDAGLPLDTESPSPDDGPSVEDDGSDSDSSEQSWGTARTSHRFRDRRVEFDPASTEIQTTVRTSTVWMDEHGHRRRSRERKRYRRRYGYCHNHLSWPLSRDMFLIIILCFVLGCLTILTFRPFAIEYFDHDFDVD